MMAECKFLFPLKSLPNRLGQKEAGLWGGKGYGSAGGNG
jgi:hypothetical protein